MAINRGSFISTTYSPEFSHISLRRGVDFLEEKRELMRYDKRQGYSLW